MVHPELGPGYDLWVGGGLSVAPRLAERLGVFVSEERAAEVWYGVVQIFRDYGHRRLRNKARLKFLLAEWGPEKFRQVLQDEYLGYERSDGPAPATPTSAACLHLLLIPKRSAVVDLQSSAIVKYFISFPPLFCNKKYCYFCRNT